MKMIIFKIYSRLRMYYSHCKLSARLKNKLRNLEGPIKLVVGSGGLFENGWIPTDIETLNLLKPKKWSKYLKKNTVSCIIAEHVWEHLTEAEGIIAARTCYDYLKKGGYLRVAVPDGYHTNIEYINYVKPGGNGAGAEDHKILYNYKSFRNIFESAGFKINLLEYFDENGLFHFVEWDPTDGKILRSKRFDERNADSLSYTSLILDAVK